MSMARAARAARRVANKRERSGVFDDADAEEAARKRARAADDAVLAAYVPTVGGTFTGDDFAQKMRRAFERGEGTRPYWGQLTEGGGPRASTTPPMYYHNNAFELRWSTWDPEEDSGAAGAADTVPQRIASFLHEVHAVACLSALSEWRVSPAFPAIVSATLFREAGVVNGGYMVRAMPGETLPDRLAGLHDHVDALLRELRLAVAQVLLALEIGQFRVGLVCFGALGPWDVRIGTLAITVDAVRVDRPGRKPPLVFTKADLMRCRVVIDVAQPVVEAYSPNCAGGAVLGRLGAHGAIGSRGADAAGMLAPLYHTPVCPYTEGSAEAARWRRVMLSRTSATHTARLAIQEACTAAVDGDAWDAAADFFQRVASAEHTPAELLAMDFFAPLRAGVPAGQRVSPLVNPHAVGHREPTP